MNPRARTRAKTRAKPKKPPPPWPRSSRRPRPPSSASPSGCRPSKASWRRRKTTRARRFRRAKSGPGNSGEAAARLVVAQSLLTALRQGDDYSSQLAALQNFGVDPTLLAPLRAGLSAPSASQLAAAFAALAPKLAAAAAPRKPADEAKPPQDARENDPRLHRSGGAQAGAHPSRRGGRAGRAPQAEIETIEKDLRAGDLAAALSSPPTFARPRARALGGLGRRRAQTRLDAEAAAKAELAASPAEFDQDQKLKLPFLARGAARSIRRRLSSIRVPPMFRILVFLFVIGLLALGLGVLHRTARVAVPDLVRLSDRHLAAGRAGNGRACRHRAVERVALHLQPAEPGRPSTTRARKRARGHEALARGIIAAGVGDARKARKASVDAKKLAPHEPLTLLLEAQAAQLSGDRAGAERAFRAMTERPETKIAGPARPPCRIAAPGRSRSRASDRAGSPEHPPLAWSGQAVLDRYPAQNDWEAARLCVAQNLRAKLIDPETANRQKAVLDTALAMECETTDPERAIKIVARGGEKGARSRSGDAPCWRGCCRATGDFARRPKLIEAAYAKAPASRPRQSLCRACGPAIRPPTGLSRAKALAKFAPNDPESAIDGRDCRPGRRAISPPPATPWRRWSPGASGRPPACA